jgi:hypothetical protein
MNSDLKPKGCAVRLPVKARDVPDIAPVVPGLLAGVLYDHRNGG